MKTIQPLSKRIFLAAAMGLALVAGGCSSDHYMFQQSSYSWASRDRYQFESTSLLPVNITVVETHSGTELWYREVPVDCALILDLDRDHEEQFNMVSGKPAKTMTWWQYGEEREEPIDQGSLNLPGVPVIIRVSYRQAHELPAGYMTPEMKAMDETPAPPTGDAGKKEWEMNAGPQAKPAPAPETKPAPQAKPEATPKPETGKPSEPPAQPGNAPAAAPKAENPEPFATEPAK